MKKSHSQTGSEKISLGKVLTVSKWLDVFKVLRLPESGFIVRENGTLSETIELVIKVELTC